VKGRERQNGGQVRAPISKIQTAQWLQPKKRQWAGARLGGRVQPDKEKELNVFLADGA
jgi:hypothetical protein